jgi:hypothetical protein
MTSSSLMRDVDWSLDDNSPCATVYSFFDKSYVLPSTIAGLLPPLPEDPTVQTICSDSIFSFVPSFGPFSIDQCGDKLVSN